jgi:hypothetical protein
LNLLFQKIRGKIGSKAVRLGIQGLEILTSLLDNFIYSFYFIFEDKIMLCKRTYKNQITLPKKVMEQFEDYEYFEVRVSKGKIVLEPVKMIPKDKILLEKVRDKIAALGLTSQDIEDAVAWARKE